MQSRLVLLYSRLDWGPKFPARQTSRWSRWSRCSIRNPGWNRGRRCCAVPSLSLSLSRARSLALSLSRSRARAVSADVLANVLFSSGGANSGHSGHSGDCRESRESGYLGEGVLGEMVFGTVQYMTTLSTHLPPPPPLCYWERYSIGQLCPET